MIRGLSVGFAITGSFCTINDILDEVEKLVREGANVYPILSENVSSMDTRFTNTNELKEKLKEITKNNIIDTIQKAEPIGPKALLDVLVVAPCTGNSIAKIANGITDTTVTMAVKAQLRNDRPVVLSISSNDALSSNGKNIGKLLNTKNIYFVPFYQDDPIGKSRSLVAKNTLILDTLKFALGNKQIQPIFYS